MTSGVDTMTLGNRDSNPLPGTGRRLNGSKVKSIGLGLALKPSRIFGVTLEVNTTTSWETNGTLR